MIIAWLKGSKFIADFRDLLTDAAKEMGVITNKTLLKFGYFLERQIYLKADMIFTISQYMKNKIESRGGNGKVYLIYNGSDEDIINWNGNIDSMRVSLGWNDKIVVCYAGLIGLPQNLKLLVPEMVNFNDDRFLFVFIGDGPGKNALVKKAEEMNINNIRFFGHMNRDQVIPLIYAADIMMVVLEELDLFKGAIPSKFYDCLGAGKPVVTNVDGELRHIMDESKTGLFFSLRDNGSFESAVYLLANNEKMRTEMGIRGKRLITEKFLRKKIMAEAISIIERVNLK
jgi:glycosyltransferase involved in cell wall biosynthesis